MLAEKIGRTEAGRRNTGSEVGLHFFRVGVRELERKPEGILVQYLVRA